MSEEIKFISKTYVIRRNIFSKVENIVTFLHIILILRRHGRENGLHSPVNNML